MVVRCSTFEEVTGLYARPHVHIKEVISISGQSKTEWEKNAFLSLITNHPEWLDANGKLTWGIRGE